MRHRKVILADGRYMIFYTFDKLLSHTHVKANGEKSPPKIDLETTEEKNDGTLYRLLARRRNERGRATMMENSVILDGDAEKGPKFGAVEIALGMDFIRGCFIDTHFAQRGRYGRLLAAIAYYPQELGIGIDENTAIVIKKRQLEVNGEGAR